MEWMGLNDIRASFLSFFESKGHSILKSYSLVPSDDKSLLIINSGMAPMKKFFLGHAKPVNNRVATCQKCVRTPDIDLVGKTSRHGTFFEMLGNFSFGDYFKEQAILWAWEFVTEHIKLPIEKLYVSVYFEDDETLNIWKNTIGLSEDRIVKLGKKDNFWEIGAGPCGPCSEIYYDRGPDSQCNNPNCFVGCECDRYVEFWNLVFSQYNSDGNGNYQLMKKPNIDTGMGLERLACIVQGVDNLFEVDSIKSIIDFILTKTNIKYGDNDKYDIAFRVITDHIRSITFMIGDGILPSNESRGYVLRRLIRRACIYGRKLGILKPFLYEIVDVVSDQNKTAYPELCSNLSYIKRIVKSEEEIFLRTLDNGVNILNNIISEFNNIKDNRILSGERAFLLYDTFGFPIELTKEILAEHDISLNEEEFETCMQTQRMRSRNLRKSENSFEVEGSFESQLPKAATVFTGYTDLTDKCRVVSIIKDSSVVDLVDSCSKFHLILDKTPFYAQGGGQIGDIGTIKSESCVLKVLECNKNSSGLFFHSCELVSGCVKVGDEIECFVDKKYRDAVKKNHTGAHLIHAALREVLGDSVQQAGQSVDDKRIRFDFSYHNPLSKEQLSVIENIVNGYISRAIPLNIYETDIEDARNRGAMALFGEKYSDIVRVVDIDGYSVELCGGTHVSNTMEIGVFKIISENSVSSGVRRIEALTSFEVLNYLNNIVDEVEQSCVELKVKNVKDLKTRCKSLTSDLKERDSLIEKLNNKLADFQLNSIIDNAQEVSGVKCTYASFNKIDVATLRKIGDKLKSQVPNIVAVLLSADDDKGTLFTVCGNEAMKKGANAGTIIKDIAKIVGGKGGGKAESAMAGITQVSKIDEAFSQLSIIVGKYIS